MCVYYFSVFTFCAASAVYEYLLRQLSTYGGAN